MKLIILLLTLIGSQAAFAQIEDFAWETATNGTYTGGFSSSGAGTDNNFLKTATSNTHDNIAKSYNLLASGDGEIIFTPTDDMFPAPRGNGSVWMGVGFTDDSDLPADGAVTSINSWVRFGGPLFALGTLYYTNWNSSAFASSLISLPQDVTRIRVRVTSGVGYVDFEQSSSWVQQAMTFTPPNAYPMHAHISSRTKGQADSIEMVGFGAVPTPVCGSGNGQSSVLKPGGSLLCSLGSSSAVNVVGTTASWTCTTSTTVNCSSTIIPTTLTWNAAYTPPAAVTASSSGSSVNNVLTLDAIGGSGFGNILATDETLDSGDGILGASLPVGHVANGEHVIIGFRNNTALPPDGVFTSTQLYNQIEWGIASVGGSIYIHDNSIGSGVGVTASDGDVISVEIEAGVVTARVNREIVHTFSGAITYPMNIQANLLGTNINTQLLDIGASFSTVSQDGMFTEFSPPNPRADSITTKAGLLTRSDTGQQEFPACPDGDTIEWDSGESFGMKCVTPSSPTAVAGRLRNSNTTGIIIQYIVADFLSGGVILDQGGLVVPEAGKYQINGSIGWNESDLVTLNACRILIYKNGSGVTGAERYFSITPEATKAQMQINEVLDLAANDRINIAGVCTIGADSTYQASMSMSVAKIGE